MIKSLIKKNLIKNLIRKNLTKTSESSLRKMYPTKREHRDVTGISWKNTILKRSLWAVSRKFSIESDRRNSCRCIIRGWNFFSFRDKSTGTSFTCLLLFLQHPITKIDGVHVRQTSLSLGSPGQVLHVPLGCGKPAIKRMRWKIFRWRGFFLEHWRERFWLISY